MLQFSGQFDGQVITPGEPVQIPVGTPLRISVEVAQPADGPAVDWSRLLDLANECEIAGPADLAERHDFYASGKRET